MKVDEWIDLATIKALTQHASATLVALVLFGLVRFALAIVKLSETTRAILEVTDELVLVGLFLWLIYQMGCALWKGRIKDASSTLVMVA
jgi:hypothetical protein